MHLVDDVLVLPEWQQVQRLGRPTGVVGKVTENAVESHQKFSHRHMIVVNGGLVAEEHKGNSHVWDTLSCPRENNLLEVNEEERSGHHPVALLCKKNILRGGREIF